METQTKVNSWFMDFKKRIDGDSPENSPTTSIRPVGHSTRLAGRTSTSGDYHVASQRSRDSGYDADPAVLSDDFTHLGLKDTAYDNDGTMSALSVFFMYKTLTRHIFQSFHAGRKQTPIYSSHLPQPNPVLNLVSHLKMIRN